jgi:hypothetical protein
MCKDNGDIVKYFPSGFRTNPDASDLLVQFIQDTVPRISD